MNKIRVLIRHAQSKANGESTVITEIPLSDQGRLDAERFAKSLKFARIPELLVCSENLRSQETAQIIQKFCFPDAPLETWESIQEFHFLDFGTTQTTTAERKPLIDLYWNQCDPYRKDPGTESWNEFYGRCIALDRKLASHPATTLLIVSHGYVMNALRTLKDLHFPAVSPELMRMVHARQIADPIRNLQKITFEYPSEGSHP
jgi:broad specificity phosphatase PhoE